MPCYVQVYTLLQHHPEFQNLTTSLRLVSQPAHSHLCVMFEFLQLPLRYQLEASPHLVPVHHHSVRPTVKQNCVYCHELVFFDCVILLALQNPSKLVPTSTASSLVLHLGELLNKTVNSISLLDHNVDATPLASISHLSQPRAVGTTYQSTPATASCKPFNPISVCYQYILSWIQLHTCHTFLNINQYLVSHLSHPP